MPFGDPWTEGQRAMAQLIDQVVQEHCQWPRFDYLDHELYTRRFSAQEIYESFVVLRNSSPGSMAVYSEITDSNRLMSHRDDNRIGLSVAGYYQLRGDTGPAGMFMRLLQAAGSRRAQLKISPIDATGMDWTDRDLAGATAADIPRSLHWLMTEFIRTEPSGLTGLNMQVGLQPESESWTAQIGPPARRFAGEKLPVEQYLELVKQHVAPPQPPSPRVVPSPLALLTALDYLNVTWQLHCPQPLFRLPGTLEPAALLAADVASKDELAGRLSTYADLLKALVVHKLEPGSLNKKHPVARLADYLERQDVLDEDDREVIERTTAKLIDIKDVRNSLLHHERPREGQEVWTRVGLPGSPLDMSADWPSLWTQIRSIAVEAALDLRSVIAKLPRNGCAEHSLG